MPVLTPGPTTRSGASAHFEASSSHSRTRTGTLQARQIPSTTSKSRRPLSNTASSSAVVERSVASRQFSLSSELEYSPRAVWVLPTSTASSTAKVNQSGGQKSSAGGSTLEELPRSAAPSQRRARM